MDILKNAPVWHEAQQVTQSLDDPRRQKILAVLLKYPELNFQDIIKKTGMTATQLSNHLKVLRENGLIDSRRGRNQRRGMQPTIYFVLPRQLETVMRSAELLAAVRRTYPGKASRA